MLWIEGKEKECWGVECNNNNNNNNNIICPINGYFYGEFERGNRINVRLL